MARHGGGYDNYLTPATTHIIASQLADTKAAALLKSGRPAVRPEWCVACVGAGRRVPVGPYLVLGGGEDGRQRRLFGGGGEEGAGLVHGGRGASAVAPAPACHPLPPPPPPATSPSHAAARAAAASARAATPHLGRPLSASTAPGARVSEFYASSRLHFIGSWRARCEALIASLNPPPPPPPPPTGTPRSFIHIDVDAFFAAVAAAKTPSLRGVPLAVCHGDAGRASASASTSEVACASYEARAAGVRAGMFLGRARALCPSLVTVPFDFDAYAGASDALYRALFGAAGGRVVPLSVDEAVVDATGAPDPPSLAADLRAAVLTATGCTASAGVGPNPLLARLAAKAAKPDGLRCVTVADADALLLPLPLADLPGVGWSSRARLEAADLLSVPDARQAGRDTLVRVLGAGAGGALWETVHGRDARPLKSLAAPRRTIGAEVNWGIRLATQTEAVQLIDRIASDVSTRLASARVRARALTLKLKLRRPGAPEPAKYMGHGICDSVSRSVALATATADAGALATAATALLSALAPRAVDLRGAGLVVSKLEPVDGATGASARREGGDVGALLARAAARSPVAAAAGAPVTASPAAGTRPTPPPPARCDDWMSASPSDSSDDEWRARRSGSGGGRAAAPPALPLGVASLSQVDATVFDALPRSVQAELLANLPRSRQQQGAGVRASPAARPALHRPHPPTPPPHLPPASQLDADVLDALPLALKRELEREYGCALGRGADGRAARLPPPPPPRPRRHRPPSQPVLRQARRAHPAWLSPSPGKRTRVGEAAPPPNTPVPAATTTLPDPDFGGEAAAAAVADAAACLTAGGDDNDVTARAHASFSIAADWACAALPHDAEGALRVARALHRAGGGHQGVAEAAAVALTRVQGAAVVALGGLLLLGTVFD